MASKKRIKRGQEPQYPPDEEIRARARDQMYQVKGGENPRTFFSRQDYGDTLVTLVTWGVNDIFFAYAFPPAGFEIADPEEVLNLKAYEGWIFQYVPQTNKFNLLVKASRDGYEFFKARRNAYKSA
jgi:hypothetical protein